ncbi:MAG: DUF4157 domain-containing protein [Desulfobacterales bacterium]
MQTKLNMGSPGDKYDQEADRVAEQIMRMPAHAGANDEGLACSECQEDEKIQTKPIASMISPLIQKQTDPAEEEEEIQAKEAAGRTQNVTQDTQADINRLNGAGRPMPHPERTFFESCFGYDFSHVRIHSGERAGRLTRAMNARAFTLGQEVVFGAGQYAPSTSTGQRLLAHELTHVVQQRSGQKRLQRKTEKSPCAVHAYDVSDPKDTAVIPSDSWLVKLGVKKSSNIAVTSVADMVSKVNSYVNNEENACSCVSRLEINGHGTDGYQSVGNGVHYVNDDKALVHDSSEDHLKQLTGIKFCPKGLFMMLGCHVGRGKGKTLQSRIANMLPGKLVGGGQHYTAGKGLGGKKVTRAGDKPGARMSERDPFLTSKYVRWHIVIDSKEYIINGEETTSTEGKAKLKAASKIKVKTPEGVIRIK